MEDGQLGVLFERLKAGDTKRPCKRAETENTYLPESSPGLRSLEKDEANMAGAFPAPWTHLPNTQMDFLSWNLHPLSTGVCHV